MNLKELGSTGVLIPEVGIGTWNYKGGPATLRRGLECGALFIDTAPSYGTEAIVGEAIRGKRDQVFVATKVSPDDFRRPDLRRSVDQSLLELKIDRIDLLQLHHPNPGIPITETMPAMSELVDEGKVRFVGVSNFSVAQLEEAQKALGKHPVVSNQVRYNIIDRSIEGGLLSYCLARKITVIAYSPLARGLHRIEDCDPTQAIAEVARLTGKSPAQVVLNWCLSRDGVVVIPGGNLESHLADNCQASDWRLTAEQVGILNARIQFRQRNRFDVLVRKYLPKTLVGAALKALAFLPRGLRRRIT